MKEKKNFWDRNARIYNRFMRKDRAAYETMYALIRPVVKAKTVLELATGTGLIAKHIVNKRKESPIETTGQLIEVIKSAIPMKVRAVGGHPAKKTFQAIRIECNRELDVLKDSIDAMIDLLNPGGRLCIITFHSLEDRIVKRAFKKNENPCTCPPNFPVCVCGNVSKGKQLTRKPIIPGEEELEYNKRAKSSKLRVFERAE